MNFRSSYLEDLAKDKNIALNAEARAKAAEYYLEVLIMQYNTVLFNCEKIYMELLNYHLFVDFITPLFEKETIRPISYHPDGTFSCQRYFKENMG